MLILTCHLIYEKDIIFWITCVTEVKNGSIHFTSNLKRLRLRGLLSENNNFYA